MMTMNGNAWTCEGRKNENESENDEIFDGDHCYESETATETEKSDESDVGVLYRDFGNGCDCDFSSCVCHHEKQFVQPDVGKQTTNRKKHEYIGNTIEEQKRKKDCKRKDDKQRTH
jgi:hypothetical protein